MPRILPDANDLIVWQLSESSGNYHNYGQFLPQNPNTDLVITNSIIQTGTGIFYPNCAQIPGTSNFPTGSSATRNYASGASTVIPNPPLTLSMWIQLRSLTTNNNTEFVGKEYRNPSISGNSWATPFYALVMGTVTTNGGGDWFGQCATSASANATFLVTDFPIPLGTWSHIGMTHDGSNLRVYLNGCQCIASGNPTVNTVSASTLSYTDGTNGFGNWKTGAIIATASGNKEEPNIYIQDIRIANVARPLSYFQKIYAAGALPLAPGAYANVQFYKLRAYDTSCPSTTPAVWIDTQISLANAPNPSPCGNHSPTYTAPEVIDTWFG